MHNLGLVFLVHFKVFFSLKVPLDLYVLHKVWWSASSVVAKVVAPAATARRPFVSLHGALAQECGAGLHMSDSRLFWNLRAY